MGEIPCQKQQQPSHILVLNKFPVIPNHFILATKAYKEQTDLLEREDLEAAVACLRAWEEQEPQEDGRSGQTKRLFAFFNSGPDSGASQPHRHLQFLPVEDMRAQEQEAPDSDSGRSWDPLIDHLSTDRAVTTTSAGLKQLPGLPFAHFAEDIPPNADGETLHGIYLRLYRAAVAATQAQESSVDDSVDVDAATHGPAAISYNLAMTVSTMMICPRRREHAELDISCASQDSSTQGRIAEAGLISLNGTILTGTLLVKAETEWNALRRRPEALAEVLAAVGFPAAGAASTSTRL